MNEKHFTNLSEKTQLQIWENNEMLEWLNSKARQEEYLQQQLQAYKDKEDKIREFIRINRYSDGMHITLKGVENILQILDGSDGNE